MKKLLLLLSLIVGSTLAASASCLICAGIHCAPNSSGGYVCVTGQPGHPCETYDNTCTSYSTPREGDAIAEKRAKELLQALASGAVDNLVINVSNNCHLGHLLAYHLHADIPQSSVRWVNKRDFTITMPNGHKAKIVLQ